MSKIDYQALREAAVAIETVATPQKLLAFRMKVTPSVVLALLDERDALNERIAELEANLAELAEDQQKAIESIKQADAAVKLAHEKFSVLAAENAGLKQSEKEFNNFCRQEYYGWEDNFTETPATDAFLAEIRAAARNEGINYTASRLAAAFNHGFINKSLREVFDVTRMILSAKEELANEAHPIDGLSGEYAEKSLEEWAEQIRKGGNQ
ncbi:ead/Ea22-like family protein [Escherichia coli]|nr:ead/Ea22-like family protein [Escherichia coli]EJC8931937.1 ead/Ea22-like family protein [Escherichia coli]EJD4674528.1 ead/Ea22-like family protein [Escherichia coli]EKL9506488.1 ead/Ea22-like family protein [Escherichia coli]ELL2496314.1 ead/Ea22-like family protein [Escherichia coli]